MRINLTTHVVKAMFRPSVNGLKATHCRKATGLETSRLKINQFKINTPDNLYKL